MTNLLPSKNIERSSPKLTYYVTIVTSLTKTEIKAIVIRNSLQTKYYGINSLKILSCQNPQKKVLKMDKINLLHINNIELDVKKNKDDKLIPKLKMEKNVSNTTDTDLLNFIPLPENGKITHLPSYVVPILYVPQRLATNEELIKISPSFPSYVTNISKEQIFTRESEGIIGERPSTAPATPSGAGLSFHHVRRTQSRIDRLMDQCMEIQSPI